MKRSITSEGLRALLLCCLAAGLLEAGYFGAGSGSRLDSNAGRAVSQGAPVGDSSDGKTLADSRHDVQAGNDPVALDAHRPAGAIGTRAAPEISRQIPGGGGNAAANPNPAGSMAPASAEPSERPTALGLGIHSIAGNQNPGPGRSRVASSANANGPNSNSVGMSEAGRQWLLSRAVEATEDSAVPSADQVEETGLQASTGSAAGALTALAQIYRTFLDTANGDTRQDLMAIAQDLATNTSVDIRPLVQMAMQPGEAADVQRQALYLAASVDIGAVKAVASNPADPLELDAQAFLFQPETGEATTASGRDLR